MSATTIITDPILTSVLTAAHETRQQCNAILDLIIAQNTSSSSSSEDTTPPQLLQAQKTLTTRLALLRGLNRKAIIAARSTKHATTEKRQEIDALHLQLQNLYYEQRHLRGEIRACEDYTHKFPLLNMLPPTEFLSLHPEFSSSSSSSSSTANNEHDLMLARIEDEHAARKDLEAKRQELEKRREGLMRRNEREKARLAALDENLEKWIVGGKQKMEKILDEGRKGEEGSK